MSRISLLKGFIADNERNFPSTKFWFSFCNHNPHISCAWHHRACSDHNITCGPAFLCLCIEWGIQWAAEIFIEFFPKGAWLTVTLLYVDVATDFINRSHQAKVNVFPIQSFPLARSQNSHCFFSTMVYGNCLTTSSLGQNVWVYI